LHFDATILFYTFYTIMYKVDTNNTFERTIVDIASIGITDVAVVGKYQYSHAHKNLKFHVHTRQMEICYCYKGEQVYVVDNQQYKIQGGDLFITFPNEKHGSGSFPEEKGELYWMIINIPTQAPNTFLGFSNNEAKALWAGLQKISERTFRASKPIKLLLDQIIQLGSQEYTDLYKVKLQHLLIGFILEVINCAKQKPVKPHYPQLQKIETFMDAHLEHNLSLSEMSQHLNLSLSYFKNWFREQTGYTPLDYFLRKKIKCAQEYLSQSSNSITAIAYQLNFSSSQYFSTVFKKYTGLSPKDYRSKFNITAN